MHIIDEFGVKEKKRRADTARFVIILTGQKPESSMLYLADVANVQDGHLVGSGREYVQTNQTAAEPERDHMHPTCQKPAQDNLSI